MARIIFTGAQGTGKTTVLKMFEKRGYPTITGVVRDLMHSDNICINENGNSNSQEIIWNEYKRRLSEPEYVSDRGLIDVLAYSLSGNVDDDVLISQANDFQKWCDENPDVIYIYFPIEFDVVADGVRSADEFYRHRIDVSIQSILIKFHLDFIQVTGTPGERLDQIMHYITYRLNDKKEDNIK